jgi:hypothetical protein
MLIPRTIGYSLLVNHLPFSLWFLASKVIVTFFVGLLVLFGDIVPIQANIVFAIEQESTSNWATVYAESSFDRPYELIKTTDLGYLVAGTNGSMGGAHHLWLVKFDSFGIIQWQFEYQRAQNDVTYVLGAVEIADQGYFIAYKVTDALYLTKFSLTGVPIWTKLISGADCYLNSSGRLFVGSTEGLYAICSIEALASVIHLDLDGNVVWTKQYDPSYQIDFVTEAKATITPKSVRLLPDSLLITGAVNFYSGERISYQDDMWVLKTDRDGGVLWQTILGQNSDYPYGIYESAEASAVVDDKVIIAGYTENPFTYEQDGQTRWNSHQVAWAVQMDLLNGSIGWQRSYIVPEIVNDNGETYLVTSNISVMENVGDAVVGVGGYGAEGPLTLKLNTMSGEILWQKMYRGQTGGLYTNVLNMVPVGSNSILSAGNYYPTYNTYQLFLVQTELSDNALASCSICEIREGFDVASSKETQAISFAANVKVNTLGRISVSEVDNPTATATTAEPELICTDHPLSAVSGRIVTKLNKPVFGIRFKVNGALVQTQTSENGEFTFENLSTGAHKIEPQSPGPGLIFEPASYNVTIGSEIPPFLSFQAIDTTPPVVSIISPKANEEIKVGNTSIVAKASEPTGGSGIDYVQFYASYNGQSHDLGTVDGVHDFTTSIILPTDLRSQQVLLAPYAYDNAGNRSALSPVIVNYRESNNNPNVIENWVTQEDRAYLNQLSLRTVEGCWRPGKCSGDYQCGVASVTMILAMNGVIGKDFQSMSDKAYELYYERDEDNKPKMNNTVEGMVIPAFENAGLTATPYWDNMWDNIVREINVGRPVLMVSSVWTIDHHDPNKLIGHFFVIVGYRKEGTDETNRKLIVYDPFGEWDGKVGAGLTYNGKTNTPVANSYKGRWVLYDFNALDDYSSIVTAVPTMLVQAISQGSSIPSSPPDLISTEEPNWGEYPVDAVDAVDLISGTFQISGLVTVLDGPPLRGADITMSSKYQPDKDLYITVTNEFGRYLILGVEPGYYYFNVHQNGSNIATREVKIVANTSLNITDLDPGEGPSVKASLFLPLVQR